MYGVPKDLDLSAFVGQQCNQIALGSGDLQLRFSGVGVIQCEGRYEIRNDDGVIIEDREVGQWDQSRIGSLAGLDLVSFDVAAPLSFSLRFANGWRVTIFDDSDRFEAALIRFDAPGSPLIVI